MVNQMKDFIASCRRERVEGGGGTGKRGWGPGSTTVAGFCRKLSYIDVLVGKSDYVTSHMEHRKMKTFEIDRGLCPPESHENSSRQREYIRDTQGEHTEQVMQQEGI